MRRRILDRLIWLLVLAMVLAGASACQTGGGSFCTVAAPIRLTDQTIAAMSDREVNDALAHNEKGARLCGWTP